MAMINTLQLATLKNLIQMSSNVINYNIKHEAKRVTLCLEAEGRHLLDFVNTIGAPHDSFTTDRSHIMHAFMKIKISTFSKSLT
jgi:hypothetical protein